MNLTWVSGFNGGLTQVFIVSIKSDFGWKNVANVTDPGEGKIVYFDTKHLNPGQTVWCRLESCNEINCSIQPAEIEIHVKGILLFYVLTIHKTVYKYKTVMYSLSLMETFL